MTLTDRELATVLFALRHAQLLVDDREDLREQGHFTDHEPLDVAEIDDLCDRLNTREDDDQTGGQVAPVAAPLAGAAAVYVLFHETNTGHTDESDGYVEAVYATEALAEAAKLAAIRAAIENGDAVWWNPEDDGPSDWEHDWRIEAHQILGAVEVHA